MKWNNIKLVIRHGINIVSKEAKKCLKCLTINISLLSVYDVFGLSGGDYTLS